jgi:N-acyl-D-amino-acid deacylase
MRDLIIRGGTIVDGTGGEPFVGDVAIDGDRIVEVGTGLGPARREIDATGLVVTPGWVDIHPITTARRRGIRCWRRPAGTG